MKPYKIKFLGAAQTVTGSATLLEFRDKKVLVDCGMFQGPKDIRKKNWELFDKELAQSLDAIILTHAHIDHSGMIPRLYKWGFSGDVFCTRATKQLCRILLPDTAYIQEEDYRRSRQKSVGDYKGPLYSIEDANECLKLFRSCPRHDWIEIDSGISFRFLRAGHILGSSIVQVSMSLENGVHIITFSGDLGNGRQLMIKGPEEVFETDDLVIESTYGDSLQSRLPPEGEFIDSIKYIYEKGSVLLIPTFAVGRAQEILLLISQLEEAKKIPQIPVFLDSPMAVEATDIYLNNSEDLKLVIKNGQFVQPLSPAHFFKIRKVEDSIKLGKKKGPLIILSASGMLTGGRILYHLKQRLPDSNNILLFVGYQADETKGQLLKNGIKNIRIHKENVVVNAKVKSIESLSAHADSDDLVEWVSQFKKTPKRVFVNHGEKRASSALAYRLRYELGLKVYVPGPDQAYDIGDLK